MRKLLASTAVGLTLFSGSMAVLGSAANAQGNDPSAQTQTARPGQDHGGGQHHKRRHQLLQAIVKTSADTIGIDSKTLVTELRSGSSIAQVARNHGVEPQKVVDALVAKGNERIDKAVADGKLDADRAAQLKAKLPGMAEKAVNHQVKPRANGQGQGQPQGK